MPLGQTPIQRFISSGPLHAVEPSLLREAFRWSVMRRVTNTASVSLAGNRYPVDQALVGRRVELRFDPEDLTKLDVYWESRPAGTAIPFILGRHVHRQVPQAHPPQPAAPTGVDYLGLGVAYMPLPVTPDNAPSAREFVVKLASLPVWLCGAWAWSVLHRHV